MRLKIMWFVLPLILLATIAQIRIWSPSVFGDVISGAGA